MLKLKIKSAIIALKNMWAHHLILTPRVSFRIWSRALLRMLDWEEWCIPGGHTNCSPVKKNDDMKEIPQSATTIWTVLQLLKLIRRVIWQQSVEKLDGIRISWMLGVSTSECRITGIQMLEFHRPVMFNSLILHSLALAECNLVLLKSAFLSQNVKFVTHGPKPWKRAG
jgi:hypothetical protein